MSAIVGILMFMRKETERERERERARERDSEREGLFVKNKK
jgi:hypothetical protein